MRARTHVATRRADPGAGLAAPCGPRRRRCWQQQREQRLRWPRPARRGRPSPPRCQRTSACCLARRACRLPSRVRSSLPPRLRQLRPRPWRRRRRRRRRVWAMGWALQERMRRGWGRQRPQAGGKQGGHSSSRRQRQRQRQQRRVQYQHQAAVSSMGRRPRRLQARAGGRGAPLTGRAAVASEIWRPPEPNTRLKLLVPVHSK